MSMLTEDIPSYHSIKHEFESRGEKAPSQTDYFLMCMANELREVNAALRESATYMRSAIDAAVGTDEYYVEEGGQWQLPVGASTFTCPPITPQTSGQEIIDGAYAAIVPVTSAAIANYPLTLSLFTFSIGNKTFDMLGQPRLMSPVMWKVQSRDSRSVTVTTPTTFPAGFQLEFYLWGHAVPQLQGGKLH